MVEDEEEQPLERRESQWDGGDCGVTILRGNKRRGGGGFLKYISKQRKLNFPVINHCCMFV